MSLRSFEIDVLKHVVVRIENTHRYQIDPTASIVLTARLVNVAGTVTAILYQDDQADFTSDDPITTSESEEGLIALCTNANMGSDAQSPLAPPTHFDYGMFVKAEGTGGGSALLELTYVHRCDYDRSFEPIQVSTWANPNEPLGSVPDLPDVPEWEEDDNALSGPPGVDAGGHEFVDKGGLLTDEAEHYIDVQGVGQTILEGGTATVSVKLSDQPSSVIGLSVTNDTGETTTSVSTLTFTADNYDTPQDVVITAINDSATESLEFGSVTVKVVSGDNVRFGPDLTQERQIGVHIVDTDTVTYGINTNFDSLLLKEGEPVSTLGVTLFSQPSANVSVLADVGGLSGRLELAAGGAYATTQALTFTNSNWATPQSLTLRVVDDSIANGVNPGSGAVTFTVTASTDSNYSALIATHRKYLTTLIYDDEADNFATGVFIVEMEHRAADNELSIQHLITETTTHFIRLE
jgi:hypothetical protein